MTRRALAQARVGVCLTLFGGLTLADSAYSDWLQFRGPSGRSMTDAELPVEFGGDQQRNVAWRVPLPGRAVNGPIVVGQQVIATASSGNQQKRLHVFSVNAHSGQIEWSRRFWATGRTRCHPLSAIAAPTPTSDGKAVYVLYASNDLVCLDLAGNVRWIRALGLDFPQAFDDRGLASSPSLVNGVLVVQIACGGDSYAFGMDAQNGQTRWKIPLAKTTSWASPTAVTLRELPMVMLQSADRLMFVWPETGEVEYEYEAEGNLIPSPTMIDNMVLLPADGMTALRFRQQTPPAVVWQAAKVGAETASPVARDGQFYVIRAPNILTAAGVSDGSIRWKKRLSGNGFWATPLLSDRYVYVVNTDGEVHVVGAADGELAATNSLGEEVLGSPAAADGAIYFRTTSQLWKIAPAP